MAQRKRKKHMKLPNGYGSIKYLGKNRRRPYGIYPPVTEWTASGPVTPPALGYTETWEEGYELLTTYNLEKAGKIKVNNNVFIDRSPTFTEVYERFFQEKFTNSPKKLSQATMYSTKAAFKNCSAIHSTPIKQIKYDDLQNLINNCPLKHASLELIVSLLHQIYKYALKYEIVEKDYSAFLYIPKENDDETGEPFNDKELNILWNDASNQITQMILIMCYSGYRIKAYETLEVNLSHCYFKGGVKTRSSKNRIVPIHPAIYDFVKLRWNGKNLLGCSSSDFRDKMYKKLNDLGIAYSNGKKHTPHDCRHTFSRLCEQYHVSENDRKRMMGHSFGNDITNAKYGHRTVEELRTELEKIQVPK